MPAAPEIYQRLSSNESEGSSSIALVGRDSQRLLLFALRGSRRWIESAMANLFRKIEQNPEAIRRHRESGPI